MVSFSDILNTSSKIDPSLIVRIKAGIKQVSIRKGTILQRNGDISLKSYFVKQGLLKSYAIDGKGKEYVFMFAPEKWLISDIEAHVQNCPALFFIEAIEDSEVEIINKNSLHLFKELPQAIIFDEFERLLKRCGAQQKRILMLMSFSAKERYDEFLKTYPDIAQRIPQRLIASYLGITPQALSTIRSNLS